MLGKKEGLNEILSENPLLGKMLGYLNTQARLIPLKNVRTIRKGLTKDISTQIPRRRSIAPLKDKELEKLRVLTWYRYLLVNAQSSDVEGYVSSVAQWLLNSIELSELIENFPDFQEDLQNLATLRQEMELEQIDFYNQYPELEDSENKSIRTNLSSNKNLAKQKYFIGLSSPSDLTLNALEVWIPGSKKVYEIGDTYDPISENLWSILDGTYESIAFIKAAFPIDPNTGLSESPERIKFLLENFVDDSYGYIDLKTLRNKMSFELIGHPVWSTFADRMLTERSNQNLEERDKYRMYIVVVWLMWLDFTKKQDGPREILEWFLMGFLQGIVARFYSVDIQTYMRNKLTSLAPLYEEELIKSNFRYPKFEDRWLQKI